MASKIKVSQYYGEPPGLYHREIGIYLGTVYGSSLELAGQRVATIPII